MASEYIQDLAFRNISQAIMATANSVASAASSSSEGNSGESSIFDVFRRKLGKMQDVLHGIAAPLKRRSMYDELPEHIWPQEHIEMSRLVQSGLGHHFLPCHLSNPTWCDYCGDFIWGLFKQCLRCQTCQYTCHQHCVPAVTLNCKSISDDGCEVVTAAKTPSPSDPRSHLETSLSMGNINTRPGCARVVPNSNSATNIIRTEVQKVPEALPNIQHVAQGSGGAVCAHPPAVQQNFNQEYVGTPKLNHSPAHHLSRSNSEGLVTAHTSHMPQPTVGYNSAKSKSLGRHILSQQCPPSNTDNWTGSLQRTHIQTHTPTQSQLKAAFHNPQPESVDISDKVIQGNSSVSDNTNNNIQQHLQNSGNTALDLPDVDVSQEATTEKDETDSGYRSGTIPDDKLPRALSRATLDQQELGQKIAKYNQFVPTASLEVTGKESFQGFVKVAMNLIRPITMELGARPPSIYELLTREHIVEENTQQVAFYMPRDTHKSLHITSDITTKEVVTSLLKKFHILDHPRKFAMYEQEFNDRNKLVRLRRLTDKDFPLRAILSWDPERIRNYRMVLQENETGEIVWDVFSLPELGNFLKVLDREEKETILELKHKYAYMKQYIERRLVELRNKQTNV